MIKHDQGHHIPIAIQSDTTLCGQESGHRFPEWSSTLERGFDTSQIWPDHLWQCQGHLFVSKVHFFRPMSFYGCQVLGKQFRSQPSLWVNLPAAQTCFIFSNQFPWQKHFVRLSHYKKYELVVEGALSNLRQFSTQSVGKLDSERSPSAVSLLFDVSYLQRCEVSHHLQQAHAIAISLPCERTHWCWGTQPKMQIDGSKLRRLRNCNEYYIYIDIIRYLIILISNRFLCSDCLHAVMLFSFFYSFHAIYVLFIEAGRFSYPGHEVGQFDDEKRDQMDMAHLACLSWKAACFRHLFLELARGVSWKCTVNFVRGGWFHQSSF